MPNRTWQPSADIFRSGDHWYVKLELAGIAPDNFQIVARGNVLTVSGTRRDAVRESTPFYQSLEIAYSSFHRKVKLPVQIEKDSICWEYLDGMLLIQLIGHKESQ